MGRVKMQKNAVSYPEKEILCVVKISVNILVKVNLFLDHCYPGTKTKLCMPKASGNEQGETENTHAKI